MRKMPANNFMLWDTTHLYDDIHIGKPRKEPKDKKITARRKKNKLARKQRKLNRGKYE